MFIYPAKAAVNRPVPKNKLYANAKPSKSVKEKFVSQISEIIWKYKLAPETTNLAARDGFTEIQIFEIDLKEPELSTDVLAVIDKAIPYPIFFQLRYDDQVKGIAAFKRPAEDGSGTWVIEEYFETGWTDATIPATPLPVALDLKALYEQMLLTYIDLPPCNGESLAALVERIRQIRKYRRELKALEAKMNSEKQFNRKVELNAKVRSLQSQLTALTKS
ncbi:MAG: DUF4391 family protein [Geobacter sp.]|nr:DUF4391 family protein [Geobacter sp.]